MGTPLKATEACFEAARTFGPAIAFVAGMLGIFLVGPWLLHGLFWYFGFVEEILQRRKSR